MSDLIRKLKLMDACKEAVEWAKNYPDLNTAWQACERGDWMLWFAGKMSGKPGSESRRKLVGTAADCGRTGLQYAAKKDMPLLEAVFDLCEGYAQGVDGITIEDLQIVARAAATAECAAYSAARAAAHAVVDAAANAAANAAADAAHAAADAAHAAANAAAHTAAHAAANAAADAAAYAAANAAAYAARAAATAECAAYSAARAALKHRAALKQCADIVRQHYPTPPQRS